jgi:chromosomal replication initiation ATPase DnaA
MMQTTSNVSPYILPGLKYPAAIARPHDETIKKVLDHYKVSMNDLKSKSRKRDVAMPRQLAMCALYILHRWTFKKVGNFLNRDHTTVIYAVQMTKNLIQTNPGFAKQVHDMFPSLIKTMEHKQDYAAKRRRY